MCRATRTDQTASYGYDTLGQLTTETNTKGSYTYSYDTYGNIRSVSGTESHTYTYGNSEWRDLLTKYDGTTISYDTNGNPTSYYNGSSYTMAWKNGRQLSSVTTGGTTTTYTYDATGVRDSKTVGSTTYKFYTANGQVGRQSGNGKNWTFFYDNQGRPNALIYDNAVYYYVLNLQGDVIGLINTSGTYVAQYAYDAWGKVISSSGTLADINPLRYRGYYYDSETGFYYLGSRYYDPAIKRFINADEATIAVADNASLSDKNLFAYCDNNPVMRRDDSGELWEFVAIAAIGGGILSGLSTYSNGGTAYDIISSALIGATISGLSVFIGDTYRVLGKTIVAIVAGATSNIVSQDYNQKMNWKSFSTDVVYSAVSGAVFSQKSSRWMISNKPLGN